MNWQLAFVAVDVATIVCAALFGARVLFCFPRQRNAQLIALLCLAVVCHVLLARYDYHVWIPQAYQVDFGAWGHLLNLLRNSAPGLFMILVQRLFSDEQRFPSWLLALFATQLLLEEPARWFFAPDAPLVWLATVVLPTLLQTLFAAVALYWTLADWRIDLVETRRRTRALILIVLAIDVVASSVLLRVIIAPGTAANYQAHLALSVINLGIMVFLLFRAMNSDIGAYLCLTEPTSIASRTPTIEDAETSQTLARLTGLLENERIYRLPGLTLETLAKRVGIPEYRLRRLIHEQLGYRNFNAFLHTYRIHEACTQLSDPELRRTPILTIGLSVGYQSINTFNRGFREVMGMTPSAYRNFELSAAGGNAVPKTA